MSPPLHPLPNLKRLMREQGTTVKVLAGVLRRSEGYVRKRLNADTHALDFTGEELTLLSAFYGVPVSELGG